MSFVLLLCLTITRLQLRSPPEDMETECNLASWLTTSSLAIPLRPFVPCPLHYLHIVKRMLLSKFFQVFLLFFRQVGKKLLILSSFAHVDNVLHVCFCSFVVGGCCVSLTPPTGSAGNYTCAFFSCCGE